MMFNTDKNNNVSFDGGSTYIITSIAVHHNILVVLRWGRSGCDPMVVRFTSTCAISAYHH